MCVVVFIHVCVYLYLVGCDVPCCLSVEKAPEISHGLNSDGTPCLHTHRCNEKEDEENGMRNCVRLSHFTTENHPSCY